MAHTGAPSSITMPQPSRFSKMHGLGNDFIIIPLPPIAPCGLVAADGERLASCDCALNGDANLPNSPVAAGEVRGIVRPSPSPSLSHGYHPALLPLMANGGRRIRALASRKRGIGCDQFIVYCGVLPPPTQSCNNHAAEEPSSTSAATNETSAPTTSSTRLPPAPAVFMWIFNGSSGSEVGMCGNAVRCVVRHFSLAYEACLASLRGDDDDDDTAVTSSSSFSSPQLTLSDNFYRALVGATNSGAARVGYGTFALQLASPISGPRNAAVLLGSYRLRVVVPKASRPLMCEIPIEYTRQFCRTALHDDVDKLFSKSAIRSIFGFEGIDYAKASVSAELHRSVFRPLLQSLNAAAAVRLALCEEEEGSAGGSDQPPFSDAVSVQMGGLRAGMFHVMMTVSEEEEEEEEEEEDDGSLPASSIVAAPPPPPPPPISSSDLPFSPRLAEAFGGDSGAFLRFVVARMELIEDALVVAARVPLSSTVAKGAKRQRDEESGEDGCSGAVLATLQTLLGSASFQSRLAAFVSAATASPSPTNTSSAEAVSSPLSTPLLVQFGAMVATARQQLRSVMQPSAVAAAAAGGGHHHRRRRQSLLRLVSVCDVGNPHCVFFFDANDRSEATNTDHSTNAAGHLLLQSLANDDSFVSVVGIVVECCLFDVFPQGVNVEFAFADRSGRRISGNSSNGGGDVTTAAAEAEEEDPPKLRMRVWERGEGITEACGSGACAVGVAGHAAHRLLTGAFPNVHVKVGHVADDVMGINVVTRHRVVLDGGELSISVEGGLSSLTSSSSSPSKPSFTVSNVIMAGGATLVASGELAM